jgi:hypothetical protein
MNKGPRRSERGKDIKLAFVSFFSSLQVLRLPQIFSFLDL